MYCRRMDALNFFVRGQIVIANIVWNVEGGVVVIITLLPLTESFENAVTTAHERRDFEHHQIEVTKHLLLRQAVEPLNVGFIENRSGKRLFELLSRLLYFLRAIITSRA